MVLGRGADYGPADIVQWDLGHALRRVQAADKVYLVVTERGGLDFDEILARRRSGGREVVVED